MFRRMSPRIDSNSSDDIEPETEPGSETAWQTEIVGRIARYDAGLSQTIPAAEVFARLRRENEV